MACTTCSALPALDILTDGRIPEKLTEREREIVRYIVLTFRNRDIAESLGLGEQTIKNNLKTIYAKLGVADRLSLALYAVRMGDQL